MKENLNLRLPRVSPDVLKLSVANIRELATPVGTAASGNRTADEERDHGPGIRVLSYRPQGGGVHVLCFP